MVFPSATATTQTRTVTATAHTLSFYGTGSVVLSGVATGTLVGTGTSNRVTLTFTPTAGSLILTVVGSVTNWQLEAGSNATSYIPTVASTVTRNADVISKSGISSLIGQTQGTIFVDLTRSITGDGRLFSLVGTGGISNNRIAMSYSSRYSVHFIYNGGFTQIFTDLNQPSVAKLCVKYDNFSYKFFVNGVLIGTYNSLTPLGLSELYLGSDGGAQSLNGGINKFLMFKTALTDQQCISMTQL